MLCVDKFTFLCVGGSLSAKRARRGENLQNLQTNLLSSTAPLERWTLPGDDFSQQAQTQGHIIAGQSEMKGKI